MGTTPAYFEPTVTTINIVQAFNNRVSEMVWCPALEDYPASLETNMLPLGLTDVESGTFFGVEAERRSEIVVTVMIAALGQGSFGANKVATYNQMDRFQHRYLDENAYLVPTTFILQTTPYRIEIVKQGENTFRFGAADVIEYPQGSEFWWHGFQLRYAVRASDWSD